MSHTIFPQIGKYIFTALFMGAFALTTLVLDSGTAAAQNGDVRDNVKILDAQTLARMMTNQCIDNWKDQKCIEVISHTSLNMGADYAAKLQKAGHQQAFINLRDKCAASTAGISQEVPAYAMESALTQCANHVVSISEETGINPDKNLYQLVVAQVLCLKGDGRCSVIEQQMRQKY